MSDRFRSQIDVTFHVVLNVVADCLPIALLGNELAHFLNAAKESS